VFDRIARRFSDRKHDVARAIVGDRKPGEIAPERAAEDRRVRRFRRHGEIEIRGRLRPALRCNHGRHFRCRRRPEVIPATSTLIVIVAGFVRK